MVIDSKLYKPSAVLCKTSHLGKVNGQVLLLRPNAFSLSSTLTAAWWCWICWLANPPLKYGGL